MKKINVLIVEDHDLLAQGIESKLKSEDKFHFQTEVAMDADAGLRLIKSKNFDLILLDLVLKPEKEDTSVIGGDKLLLEIRKMELPPKVIVISRIDALDMLDYVVNQLGVEGYILKSRKSLTEILPAIEEVLNGRPYFSPSVEGKLRVTTDLLDLDRTNRLILKFLSQGLKQWEMVDPLASNGIHISVSAIEKRIKGMKDSLGAKTNPHLIALAFQERLINP